MSFTRDLTLKQIRAFAAVARSGSITKAAAELCVTPPAISSQLKTLRHLVGADILVRETEGIKPTRLGEEVLELSDRLEAIINASSHRLGAVKDGKSGTLGLAVVSTGKYFAPTIMAAFQKAYPDIELRPVIGNRRRVLNALENGAVDVAIMGRPPARLNVKTHILGEHPNILIAPPNHRLAGKKNISPADLLKETLLTRELGSGTRILAVRFMDRFGEGLGYPRMEIGSNESIKQAVMAGMGIAMISAHTVMTELQSKRLVALDLPGLPIIRHWILVHLKNKPLSAATKKFHDFMLEHEDKFIPKYSP